MSWFKSLLSGGLDKIVDSVGTAIDKVVTSDEEKLILRNELVKIKTAAEIEQLALANKYEEEITKRQELDMKSDSWLSKNIRPLAFIFMLAITTLFTFTDGNLTWTFGDGAVWSFTVKEGWQELWTTLTVTFAAFYAGGRTIEKYGKIKSK